MFRVHILIITFLLMFNTLAGQSLTLKCIEKERKNPDGKYPIIVRTCFIKKIKFKETSYPDIVGRYFDSEYEVNWGLSGACRTVDGTIVSFKLSEIKKYLK